MKKRIVFLMFLGGDWWGICILANILKFLMHYFQHTLCILKILQFRLASCLMVFRPQKTKFGAKLLKKSAIYLGLAANQKKNIFNSFFIQPEQLHWLSLDSFIELILHDFFPFCPMWKNHHFEQKLDPVIYKIH